MIEFSDFKLEQPYDYSYYEDEYEDDEDEKSQDDTSKCSYDVLTIEEHDSDGTPIQSSVKKHCETMPKKMNTTNAVTVKFVFFLNFPTYSLLGFLLNSS